MDSFKKWWYKDKINSVEKEAKKFFEENSTKYEEYDTKDKFEKEFDKYINKELPTYLNSNTINSSYKEIKKPLLQQFANNLELEKLKEELKNKQREVVYRTEYYESYESRRIREENARNEQNRQNASRELPNALDIIRNNFLSTMKEKISRTYNIIEKLLNEYSPSSLKTLLQNVTLKEKLKDILIFASKNEIEKILLISYEKCDHFNIILIGKTGIGKSTLINGVFEFPKDGGAKTGDGKPITQEYEEFISDKRKYLRLIDSRGIEIGENGVDAVFNSTKELIEKRAREGDPDKLIHCIWYCFRSSDLRFENIEKETLSLLMSQYNDNKLPIIIVITQNYDDEKTEIMTKMINEEFQGINKEINILPVIAEDYIQKKKNKVNVIEKEGIDELIKLSLEKSENAKYDAILKSIKEKTIQAFNIKTEEKKNKLKENLKEKAPKVLDENIKEDERLDINISKLSPIFEEAFNSFFEIPNIDEQNKISIALFLDDVCQWCTSKLDTIIKDLINHNSNELAKELLKEQTNIKTKHNAKSALDNEKTLEQYINESEEYLKNYIINQVNYLAVKCLINILSEHLIEMSDTVIKEKFNEIIPELTNIMAEKLKEKISQKIMQGMVKN